MLNFRSYCTHSLGKSDTNEFHMRLMLLGLVIGISITLANFLVGKNSELQLHELL
jgi:hypothetical protein